MQKLPHGCPKQGGGGGGSRALLENVQNEPVFCYGWLPLGTVWVFRAQTFPKGRVRKTRWICEHANTSLGPALPPYCERLKFFYTTFWTLGFFLDTIWNNICKKFGQFGATKNLERCEHQWCKSWDLTKKKVEIWRLK